MRCAVQEKCHAIGQAACHRDADRGITPYETTDAPDGRGTGKNNQIRHLPPVQWQLHHANVIHHLADSCCARFHQRRVRLNLDSVGNFTHCENRVDHGIRAHLQHDPRLHKCPETRESRIYSIGTDRKIREDV